MSEKPPSTPANIRQELLRLAREAIEHSLESCSSTSADKGAKRIDGQVGGLFVTLWVRGRLRGCVGSLAPVTDLGGSVIDLALAALRDWRFQGQRWQRSDLDDLVLEVSLLSEPHRVTDPLSLVPGVHGVWIRRGDQTGCFLPKVAAERNWTTQQTLENCCSMKAGLPADAWRDAQTEVSLFTAEVFSERTEGVIPARGRASIGHSAELTDPSAV